jgi:hypothetical protein
VAPDQGDQAARAQGKAKPNAKPPRTYSKRQPTERDLAEVSDIWRHLQDRLRTLGSEYYPFGLDNDGRGVRLRKSLAPAHRTYIAMLLCSNLNRIDRSYHQELTESFERMGAPAMQAWLGRWYRVELFGTSAASEDLYGGQKLRDAIKMLGQDLGWPARKKAIKGIGRKGGDRGLDIVAYRIDQSGDVRNHWLVFFAQCGVGKNWKPKQQEPSWARWRKLLDITGPMQPVLLMPYWQRETGGELRDETWITVDVVFLDRLRLMGLLGASPEHPAAPPVAAGAFETG